MSRSLFRTKPIQELLAETTEAGHTLKKALRAWDLVAIGIGCIIGVGIFVLPGVQAAHHSGPGIILSFAIAALACACSALCYAELAAMIPVSGSAYTYGYATLGELPGWIIGWDLILEYIVASIAVAIGWSGYFVNIVNSILLNFFGITLPVWCSAAPGTVPGAVINLPAMLIVLFLTTILVIGIKESARLTSLMVFVKVITVLVFVLVGFSNIDPSHWVPFMPFGLKGVMAGAAIVFFAYIGFDAVSTAAEETKKPQKNIPIGIIASLAICTVLYIVVAAILTGIVSFKELNHPAPVAHALNVIGFQ